MVLSDLYRFDLDQLMIIPEQARVIRLSVRVDTEMAVRAKEMSMLTVG